MEKKIEPTIFTNKKVIIFDVDGTLYAQRGLRKQMLKKMIRYHLFRPRQWINIPIILAYRKIREAAENTDFGEKNMEQVLCEKVAKKYFCSATYVQKTIEKWMQNKPLPLLKSFRYPGLPQLLKALSAKGFQLAVYSDLPADSKLKALELQFDLVIDSTMPEVNCLKPHPKGLIHICNHFNINSSSALFIGDRVDRDKACAERIQMDALIVTNGESFYLELTKVLEKA